MASGEAPTGAIGPSGRGAGRTADRGEAPTGTIRARATGAALEARLGGPDGPARALARRLFQGWRRLRPAAFAAWQPYFVLATGDATQRAIVAGRRAALGAVVGAGLLGEGGEDDEAGAIFAIHTAVAVVARVVAVHAVGVRSGDPRGTLVALEAGDLLPAYGVAGLGDDPFGWYLDAWDAGLEAAIGRVFRAVAEVFGDTADGRRAAEKGGAGGDRGDGAEPPASDGPPADLFRALYESLVPAIVRHSLGEFYTPAWLAEAVVEGALARRTARPGGAGAPRREASCAVEDAPTAPWRALDPCAGSGTFLLALLGRILAETDADPPAERLAAVVARVAGIDLNPIATLTARVNYLVAIAPLIAHAASAAHAPGAAGAAPPRADRPPLVLPVFHGDATHGSTALPGLGHFDVIVGNPPWVDWKRLPASYRDDIRSRGVARHLFSGDRVVGGINLNLCALVAHVALDTWLAPGGVLAFLMPRSLLFQQSHAGFRELRVGDARGFGIRALEDWTDAGQPFPGVGEAFLTWYIAASPASEATAPDTPIPAVRWRATGPRTEDAARARPPIAAEPGVAGACDGRRFAWARDPHELRRFRQLAGECAYLGREGIELYPQEAWLFHVEGEGAAPGTVRVRNFQGTRSRYHVAAESLDLEAEWLHPLVKGVDIRRFGVTPSGLVVPFAYDFEDVRLPIPLARLRERAPRLAAWFAARADVLAAQPAYNQRIIGRGAVEPHALARVGRYSFAPHHVVFRDNTRWGAAVVSALPTPWGVDRRPCFQNHAVSISERPGARERHASTPGAFLGEEEAHYLCAALNVPLVGRFLHASSDSRSFQIRPPVRVPLFRPDDPDHHALAALSRRAHAPDAPMAEIDATLDETWMRILGG